MFSRLSRFKKFLVDPGIAAQSSTSVTRTGVFGLILKFGRMEGCQGNLSRADGGVTKPKSVRAETSGMTDNRRGFFVRFHGIYRFAYVPVPDGLNRRCFVCRRQDRKRQVGIDNGFSSTAQKRVFRRVYVLCFFCPKTRFNNHRWITCVYLRFHRVAVRVLRLLLIGRQLTLVETKKRNRYKLAIRMVFAKRITDRQ